METPPGRAAMSETFRSTNRWPDANSLTALRYISATRGLHGNSKDLDAATRAIHCRPQTSRQGAGDAVHPVQQDVDVPLVVHRVDRLVEPGRRGVVVDERVEQPALVVEAGGDPRAEDVEVPP